MNGRSESRQFESRNLSWHIGQHTLAGFSWVVAAFCFFPLLASATPTATPTTVGMPGRFVDLILPGSELEVAPIGRDSPMVVRILQTIGHGNEQMRYEIEYYGLEPGDYDLTEFLRRKDGTSSAKLPAVRVHVQAQLGTAQVQPNPLVSRATPRIGGYVTWLAVGGVIWILGLIGLLFAGKNGRVTKSRMQQEPSLADRLGPLVQQAMQGELPKAQQAQLERMLLTYWRDKLNLNETDASQAIVELRNHEIAGELLRQLESWLHMPADRRTAIDISEILKPYRDIEKTPAATSSLTKGS